MKKKTILGVLTALLLVGGVAAPAAATEPDQIQKQKEPQ